MRELRKIVNKVKVKSNTKVVQQFKIDQVENYIFSYFYSTTKHEILQISNHNLLCSLDPPNQSRLF